MCTSKKVVLFFTLVISFCAHVSAEQSSIRSNPFARENYEPGDRGIRQMRIDASHRKYGTCGPIYANIFKDILFLNLELLHWDSFKVATSIFPFYVAARMVDEDWQSHFHCRAHHKNRNGLPTWCHSAAQYSLAIPLIGLGSLAFLGVDEEMRVAGWTFILGFPFLIFGNKINKRWQFEGCHRPWHEKFSHVKRSGGGFPSGHMAEVTYMAALFGMRYGPKWGFPLAAYGAFVGVDFWTCNRHYLSQLVAGVGWGLMYAFASDRFIDKKVAERVNCKMAIDFQGSPAINFSYDW